MVRTNHLCGKLSKGENYYYLSGLLIGAELKEVITITTPLTVVGNELLMKLYSLAFKKLGISECIYEDAGKAIIKGHCKIYELYKTALNADF